MSDRPPQRPDRPPPATPAAEPEYGPITLRLGVLVLWVEGALLAALGAVELSKVLTGDPSEASLAFTLIVAPFAAGALLVQLGRWLVRRKGWARGPAIVLQLMALPVAFFMISGEGGPLTRLGGVFIALITLFCAGLLLAPSSRSALTLR